MTFKHTLETKEEEKLQREKNVVGDMMPRVALLLCCSAMAQSFSSESCTQTA